MLMIGRCGISYPYSSKSNLILDQCLFGFWICAEISGMLKKPHLFNLSSYRLTVEIRLFQSNLICNQLPIKPKSCPSHCIRKQQGEKYLLSLMIPILYLITYYIYLNTSKAKSTIDRPKAQIKMTLRLMKLLLSQLIQVKMLAMSYLLLTGSDYTSTFFGRTKCTF